MRYILISALSLFHSQSSSVEEMGKQFPRNITQNIHKYICFTLLQRRSLLALNKYNTHNFW